MLITADWVLPVSRPPIRNGAILVEQGRIAAVGRTRDLEALHHDAKQQLLGQRSDHDGPFGGLDYDLCV